MQVVRVYSGEDGESHFEELELPYETVATVGLTAMRAATGIQFLRTVPGSFSDWHQAPRRQYVIALEGQAEIGLGDGSKRDLPDIMLTGWTNELSQKVVRQAWPERRRRVRRRPDASGWNRSSPRAVEEPSVRWS